MALGNRPDPATSRQREVDAWDLARQGYSQRAIAARLKISQPSVHAILDRVSQRLLKTLEQRVKREKTRQSEVLDYILEEALEAWRASKEAFKSSTKKTRRRPARASASGAIIRDPDGDAADSLEEILNRAESRHGNPSFLDQARSAMADKRKIWGLDIAPAPQASTNPLDKLAPEELDALAQRLEQQLADARRGSK